MKWEHHVVASPDDFSPAELIGLGAEGWELVTIVTYSYENRKGEVVTTFIFYFKRPINEKPEPLNSTASLQRMYPPPNRPGHVD